MAAGRLRERLTFSKRVVASDGYGNEVTTWDAQFTVSARVLPLKGGEAVQAARLAGTQPVILSVRYSSLSILIGVDWKAADARSGVEYNLKSIMNTDEKKIMLDILATSGEVVG